MRHFDEWEKIFNSGDMYLFNLDISGILWLKIKSLIRKEILDFMSQNFNITLNSTTQKDKFREIYDLAINNRLSMELIDLVLQEYNVLELQKIEQDFTNIESELYKINHFVWGGDSTNSLDKQIVSIIKNTYKYKDILFRIDNDISYNTRNYTLSSWYNNWTTILTEHIFKSHKKVLSASGKIKSVDFFIDNIPLDLKITYFPKEFLKEIRKKQYNNNEIVLLKNIAKKYNINFDKLIKEEYMKYQIIQQINDSNNYLAINELNIIKQENFNLINETIANKNILIKWLYENQGEMRFGSENRIFIVFVDYNDFNNAWKLKRNFNLIKPKINNFLDNFNCNDFVRKMIQFNFKGKVYKTLSDIIFIKQ